MPLNDFVSAINDHFSGLVPGIKVYGIARSIVRRTGTVVETLPGIVSYKGEIEYVGIDDVNSVRIYHKSVSISTTQRNNGSGNNIGDIVNTYGMAMFVYLDRAKLNLDAEEFFLYLQANMPDNVKADPFAYISFRLTNVNLNPEQVFAAEYRGIEFSLPAEKTFFQVNYTIETVLKKQCFATCPEGLKC